MLGTHCISRFPGCSRAPTILAPARPRIRSHHGFRHRESRKRSRGSGHRLSGRQPSRITPGVLERDRATRQRPRLASPLIRRSQRTTASGFALSGVVEPDGWRGMTGQPTLAMIAKLWMPALTPTQGAEARRWLSPLPPRLVLPRAHCQEPTRGVAVYASSSTSTAVMTRSLFEKRIACRPAAWAPSTQDCLSSTKTVRCGSQSRRVQTSSKNRETGLG